PWEDLAPDSRWMGCLRVMQVFAAQARALFPQGIDLTLFDEQSQCYERMDLDRLEDLFSKTMPAGSTYAARPLNGVLQKYFSERESGSKPLLITIVTDGRMDDEITFRQTIKNAIRKMAREGEIIIVILKFGESGKFADRSLENLDKRLSPSRAKFDVVEVRAGDEVMRNGLLRTLADVVKRKGGSEAD